MASCIFSVHDVTCTLNSNKASIQPAMYMGIDDRVIALSQLIEIMQNRWANLLSKAVSC